MDFKNKSTNRDTYCLCQRQGRAFKISQGRIMLLSLPRRLEKNPAVMPTSEKRNPKEAAKCQAEFPLAPSCLWCKAGGRVGDVSEITPTVPGFW